MPMQLAAAQLSFIAVRRASQRAQLVLGVSTRLAILPSLCGAATVAAGAVASVVASDVVCRVASDSRVSWNRRLQRYSIQDIALAGIGIYAVLNRGRFWTLSPSCLQAPGAFARVRGASLPAGLRYATKSQRKAIQVMGTRHGCHTCGFRYGACFHQPWTRRFKEAPRYIADHVPPLWRAKRKNRSFWRQLLDKPVEMRFFPQCKACSARQSRLISLLRNGCPVPRSARAVLHSPRLCSGDSLVGSLLVGGAIAYEKKPADT